MDQVKISNHPVYGFSVRIGDTINDGDEIIKAGENVPDSVVDIVKGYIPEYISLCEQKANVSGDARREISGRVRDLFIEINNRVN